MIGLRLLGLGWIVIATNALFPNGSELPVTIKLIVSRSDRSHLDSCCVRSSERRRSSRIREIHPRCRVARDAGRPWTIKHSRRHNRYGKRCRLFSRHLGRGHSCLSHQTFDDHESRVANCCRRAGYFGARP